MRIISGSARGRRLAEFTGSGIRPTPDRVREAVFSILISRLDSLHQRRVLEICAGTGAMSLEALSRGANATVLIDSSPQAAKLIRDNISRCKMEQRATLISQSAQSALPLLAREKPFDLIFMDPPYNKKMIPQILEQLATLQLLAQNGIICAESSRGEQFELPSCFERIETRHYGNSEIHLIGHQCSEDP